MQIDREKTAEVDVLYEYMIWLSVPGRTILMSAHAHYPPVTVEEVIDDDASPALYPLIGDGGPLLYEVGCEGRVSSQHHDLRVRVVADLVWDQTVCPELVPMTTPHGSVEGAVEVNTLPAAHSDPVICQRQSQAVVSGRAVLNLRVALSGN